MLHKRSQRIWARGLLVLGVTLMVPWASYTKSYYSGNDFPHSRKVVRPVAYFLYVGDKEIMWAEMLLQSCSILCVTAAISLSSEKQ